MPLVPLSDIHLHVCIEGSGPPLLLVHGFPLDHKMWRSQIDHFSSTHTVIVPDLRGFGQSDATTGVVMMEQFADDLIEMLDELAVSEPVCLCGLSMGGYIAFQFIRRHPGRVSRLVLCDTRAAGDTPEAAARRRDVAERVSADGPDFLADSMPERLYAPSTLAGQPELVARTRTVIRKTSRIGIAAASRGMAERHGVTAWLREIRVPTLAVVGEHDTISPAEEMQSWSDAIPGAQFVRLADAGHMSPEEQPGRFNQSLEKFLQA